MMHLLKLWKQRRAQARLAKHIAQNRARLAQGPKRDSWGRFA